MPDRPKVTVTVLIFKDGKVLLGERASDMIGGEMFQTPGGHLENGESMINCALREIKEEVDVKIKNLRFASICNVTAFPPNHHVVIGLIADWEAGEARLCEPDKCLGWDWYDLDALPAPLTPGTEAVIKSHQEGQSFFD